MPLFSPNYQRPGPGVPKNAPKKKGIPRFFEILGRDFADIWKASTLTVLCLVPVSAVFSLMWIFRQYLGMLLIGLVAYIIASIPVGPALCAAQSIISRAVRDEPCFFWHEYKKAWKSCFKQGVPMGIVISLLFGAGCMALGMLVMSDAPSAGMLALLLFSLLVQTGVWLLVTLQMVYMNVPAWGLLRNGLLIFFGRAKRTLPASLLTLAILLGLYVLLGPWLFPLPLIIGVPGLLLVAADMWMWPPMDELFHLEQRLTARREARARGEEDPEDTFVSARQVPDGSSPEESGTPEADGTDSTDGADDAEGGAPKAPAEDDAE